MGKLDRLQKETTLVVGNVKMYNYCFFFSCVLCFPCHTHTLALSQGFTDDQLALVEQNTVMVEERERDIQQIVQSISDLNEIFRDLAGMVVEQVSFFFFFFLLMENVLPLSKFNNVLLLL